jgi:signal transduction histidine kinase
MLQVKFKLEKLPEDVVLELDLLRLNQVLVNLCSNALKFSKSYDIIHVRLKLATVPSTD